MSRTPPRRSHLGAMLTLYRTARGWTVRDVAPRIGVSVATLSRIERGHATDADTWIKIMQWLGAPELDDEAPR